MTHPPPLHEHSPGLSSINIAALPERRRAEQRHLGFQERLADRVTRWAGSMAGASKRMHGFLTRDGVAPDDFRRRAHRDLGRYGNVVFQPGEVASAKRRKDGTFSVRVEDNEVRARKLLIATGVFDQLPPIEGIEPLFGIVFKSGRALSRAALFFDTPSHPQSTLAQSLGCQVLRHRRCSVWRLRSDERPWCFRCGKHHQGCAASHGGSGGRHARGIWHKPCSDSGGFRGAGPRDSLSGASEPRRSRHGAAPRRQGPGNNRCACSREPMSRGGIDG